MDRQKAKIVIVLVSVLSIFIGSIYCYQQKKVSNVNTDIPLGNDYPAAKESTELVVYISGAVVKPGVLKINNSCRVQDVIEYAGGLTSKADIAKINLAQKLKDGMHINVTAINTEAKGEKQKKQLLAKTRTIKKNTQQKVNINTATKAELCELQGLGPKMAEKILEYRTKIGFFTELTDICNVKGMTDAKFNKIKADITV